MTDTLQTNSKLEFSAGGVVFKQEDNQILILLCQHSYHHGWVFPKGLIGDQEKFKGQTKEETAVRETQEETGANGEILKPLTPVKYWYIFEGVKIKKTVYYFIMKYIGGDITKHDFEMENVEWLPTDQVQDRLTYKSDKKVWAEAKNLLVNL